MNRGAWGGGTLGMWKLGSFRIIARAQAGGNLDFEIPGLGRDAGVGWARFITPLFLVLLCPQCNALYHEVWRLSNI